MARIGKFCAGTDRRLAELAEIGELERQDGCYPADVGSLGL
jgi:hypothetical protein